MSTHGNIMIESAIRQIWGDNYNKFMTTKFPAHASFFCKQLILLKPMPVYIMSITCTAYAKPFNIIVEIMDATINEEKLSIYLSAYSPQFLANRGTSVYKELEKLVNHIKSDPRYDLDYKLEMHGINNKTGCRLTTYTNSEDSLVDLIRNFYDEAKFVFGEMTYDFKNYF